LKREGWLFGEPQRRIENRLQRLMGGERYADWLDASDKLRAGVAPVSSLYECLRTRAEAVVAMSHQAALTEKCFLTALDLVEDRLGPGTRVVELGCFVGDTTRWLALRHPSIHVFGIDPLEHLVTAAKTLAPPNCTFICAEYKDLGETEGRFDILISVLGIDFPTTDPDADRSNLFVEDPSDTLEVRRCSDFLMPILEAWRRMARPSAAASLVLRIPSFERFWAFNKAAEAAGWSLAPTSLRRIDGGGEGALPAFAMTAASSDRSQHDLQLLLCQWTQAGFSRSEEIALFRYRTLRDRQPTARAETRYRNGHILVREVGQHAGGGYVYDYATTLYRKLKLVASEEADPERVGMKVSFGMND
jgi:SAM-dependent methyltransferase